MRKPCTSSHKQKMVEPVDTSTQEHLRKDHIFNDTTTVAVKSHVWQEKLPTGC